MARERFQASKSSPGRVFRIDKIANSRRHLLSLEANIPAIHYHIVSIVFDKMNRFVRHYSGKTRAELERLRQGERKKFPVIWRHQYFAEVPPC